MPAPGLLACDGFKTFIVSGGGVYFMCVFSKKVYGIPPDEVVGSSAKLRFELRDGKPSRPKRNRPRKDSRMGITRIPILLAGLLSLTCCCFLAGNAALAQEQKPQAAAGGTLTIDLAKGQKSWTGDLDGMIERRVIRVLTVNSKTIYFLDKGVPRGTAVEYVRLLEEELNKKLAAEKKRKNKKLKMRAVFIPV